MRTALLRLVRLGAVSAGLWFGSGTVSAAGVPEPATSAQGDELATPSWCAPELEEISTSVCFHAPPRAVDRAAQGTVVLFLHSLISARPGSAWEQQRRMARLADAYGFSMLVPQGRPGLGPGRDARVLAWPTALELQAQYEEQLLAEWQAALAALKARGGKVSRLLVFGFSNGAYYATSLALRGRMEMDGVAVFAGGSGGKYQRWCAARTSTRVPIFVGYGRRDPDHVRQQQLARLLKQLSWPHHVLASSVGHTVTDAQVRAALRFLGHLRATPQ